MLAVLLMETTHHVQIVRVSQMEIMFLIIVMYVIMMLRMIVYKIVQVHGVVTQNLMNVMYALETTHHVQIAQAHQTVMQS